MLFQKTYQVKPLHHKKKENYQLSDKLMINQHLKEPEYLTVNYLSLALSLQNYLESTIKDVWTQSKNTLFEFLVITFTLLLFFHFITIHCKSTIILKSIIQKYSKKILTKIKKICFLNTTAQELKSQKNSITKIQI